MHAPSKYHLSGILCCSLSLTERQISLSDLSSFHRKEGITVCLYMHEIFPKFHIYANFGWPRSGMYILISSKNDITWVPHIGHIILPCGTPALWPVPSLIYTSNFFGVIHLYGMSSKAMDRGFSGRMVFTYGRLARKLLILSLKCVFYLTWLLLHTTFQSCSGLSCKNWHLQAATICDTIQSHFQKPLPLIWLTHEIHLSRIFLVLSHVSGPTLTMYMNVYYCQ